jgi:F0F1-type ATP synthase delta subunit
LKLYTTSGTLASFLYAEAEHGNKADFDKVGQSLADLYNELAAHSKAKEFLLTPTNTRGEKIAFLKAFGKSLKLNPLVESFVVSMINNNVIREFPKMVQDYNALLRAREKTVEVSVTLFSKDQPKPKPETVRNLLNYGNEAKINLSVNYDPNIAGGAVLRGPDRILDCSFKKELDALRGALEKQQRDAKAAKRAEFFKALAQYGDNLA